MFIVKRDPTTEGTTIYTAVSFASAATTQVTVNVTAMGDTRAPSEISLTSKILKLPVIQIT